MMSLGCGSQVVTYNNPPVATIISHADGAQFSDGQLVQFRGAVTDIDTYGARLNSSWYRDGEPICVDVTPDSSGVTVCEIEMFTETTFVRLVAMDDAGETDEAEVLVDVCAVTFYADTDGDGYGDPERTVAACEMPSGYVDNAEDCDDSDEFVRPGAEELCADGVDDDCDGRVDEGCLGSNCFEDDSLLENFEYERFFGRLKEVDFALEGHIIHDFEFYAPEGFEFLAHLWSDEFDAKLELYDADCELVEFSSDGGRGTNPLYPVRTPSEGIWTLVVTTETPGELGDYVLEVFDAIGEPGEVCGSDTYVFDLMTEPYVARLDETLSGHDTLFPDEVGTGHFYDDIEFQALYGDIIWIDHNSAAYDPALNLYDYQCNLVTYDTNSGTGNGARINHQIERTGVYTVTPWGEGSWSLGSYMLNAKVIY